MKSNRGGIREGAGRKPSGKQSVVVRVPVELLQVIEDAKLGVHPELNLNAVTDNELVEELERRGFEVSIYVEPNPVSKAAQRKKKNEQKKVIEQNEENKIYRRLTGGATPKEILRNTMNKYLINVT
jgi:hypothetical protein